MYFKFVYGLHTIHAISCWIVSGQVGQGTGPYLPNLFIKANSDGFSHTNPIFYFSIHVHNDLLPYLQLYHSLYNLYIRHLLCDQKRANERNQDRQDDDVSQQPVHSGAEHEQSVGVPEQRGRRPACGVLVDARFVLGDVSGWPGGVAEVPLTERDAHVQVTRQVVEAGGEVVGGDLLQLVVFQHAGEGEL